MTSLINSLGYARALLKDFFFGTDITQLTTSLDEFKLSGNKDTLLILLNTHHVTGEKLQPILNRLYLSINENAASVELQRVDKKLILDHIREKNLKLADNLETMYLYIVSKLKANKATFFFHDTKRTRYINAADKLLDEVNSDELVFN